MPIVLISEKKLSSLNELLPLLEKVVQAGKPLLIIADDVEGEVMAALVVNKLRGSLKVAAVKAPAYGELRKAILQDIALHDRRNGDLGRDLGLKLENLSLDLPGRARKVTIDKQNTTIVGGAGKKADIEARIAQIRLQLERHSVEENDIRLRPRKAAGAAGQADRRHRRDPGRRRDRNRDPGEEGSHPKRHACDARRDRGRHLARRRRRLAAGKQGRRQL